MESDVRASWENLHRAQQEERTLSESMATVLHTSSPSVVRLSNGDWHVCERERCFYACMDEDHNYYCSLSGLSWGVELMRENDPTWSGRFTASSDPDILSGTPSGGWRHRHDAFAKSHRAFQVAHQLSDAEVNYVETPREKYCKRMKPTRKKGACCVDENDEVVTKRKKALFTTEIQSQETIGRLTTDINVVIERLTSTKRDPCLQVQPHHSKSDDPRLHNPEFVLHVAVRQFIKHAAANGDRLDYSRLHDIAVYSHNIAMRKRQEVLSSKSTFPKTTEDVLLFAGETKSRVVSLVIAVWKAACATTYLTSEARRGADSFRPFCSGVLYGLKRGIRMKNGLVIVPCIERLGNQLPTLRSTNSSKDAKRLQASSHRGLCTLHRSISSFETYTDTDEYYDHMRVLFEDAARVAEQLRNYCEAACC